MNFVSAPLPLNEERRAQAVARTGLMDSNQAELFNVYCEIAKDITGYETVLFQLFGVEDRCIMAEIPQDSSEVQNNYSRRPKEGSVCAYVLLDSKPLLAFDISKHEITKSHPNDKKVKSYIGFPIINKDNYALGMVCLMTFSEIKYVEQDKIDLVEKLIKRAAHQIDIMSDQKQLTTDRVIRAIEVFNEETSLNEINDFKSFIHICSGMIIPSNEASKFLELKLCQINKDKSVELSIDGIKLQDKMGLHTKVLNQLKVEGNKADVMFEEMLNKLED